MEQILFQYEINATTWGYLSSLMVLCIFFKFSRFWCIRNLDLVLLVALAPGVLLVDHARLLTMPHSDSVAQAGYVWLLAVGFLWLVRLLVDTAMVRRPLLEPNLSTGGLTFMLVALLVFVTTNVVTEELPVEQLIGSRQLDQMLGRLELPAEENGLDRFGPGYPLLQATARLPSVLMIPADPSLSEDQRRRLVHGTTTKTLAILAHLAVVMGLIYIGYRHFENIRTGIAAAALYMLLPVTAYLMHRVDHVLPAALLVWALAAYRMPVVSGLLLGLAAGSFYYPIFLVPLWAAFYWQRGVVRFALGLGTVLAVLAGSLLLISSDFDSWLRHLSQTTSWLLLRDDVRGVWEFYPPVYRIPMLTAFVVMSASFAIWPVRKNLGTLLSCSASVMLGTQFWHSLEGGLYLGWFLPMILLTVFRPNLEHRVAEAVLGELRFPRRIWQWGPFRRAA